MKQDKMVYGCIWLLLYALAGALLAVLVAFAACAGKHDHKRHVQIQPHHRWTAYYC